MVRGEDGHDIEVQIRTAKMHFFAGETKIAPPVLWLGCQLAGRRGRCRRAQQAVRLWAAPRCTPAPHTARLLPEALPPPQSKAPWRHPGSAKSEGTGGGPPPPPTCQTAPGPPLPGGGGGGWGGGWVGLTARASRQRSSFGGCVCAAVPPPLALPSHTTVAHLPPAPPSPLPPSGG